jgi:predicted CoA-substrate-specific enzyme activase
MIFAGIDAGSRTIKVALVDETLQVLACGIEDQGVPQAERSQRLLDGTLRRINAVRSDVSRIAATGYGSRAVAAAELSPTEISCQAHGIRRLVPEARTIIDIGGQDSKVIRLDGCGRLHDFSMNDRCAAGTGRFLEVLARWLDLEIERLGEVAAEADWPVPINSTCAVFAETEIVGLLASGESPSNIVAGVQNAIASRIASMAGRSGDGATVLTGGVALIGGMQRALEAVFGHPIIIAKNPQMTGALGAAVLAVRNGTREKT